MTVFTGLLLVCTVISAITLLSVEGKASCDSPQYLELGKPGTINCLFHEEFHQVLWYNTSDFANNDPILDYQRSVTKGHGYTSGEFDVHSNGSLIINNVSLKHEHTYKVVYFRTPDESVFMDVEVFITVKPLVPFPVFNVCGNASNICYANVDSPFLQCSVRSGRPAIPLHVVSRTGFGDVNISHETIITQEGVGYTSNIVTQNVFYVSPLLVLLVCKAYGIPEILQTPESFILAQNSHISLSSEEATVKYFEKSSRMELNCTDSDFSVWKKSNLPRDTGQELLDYSVRVGESFAVKMMDEVTLGNKSSLIIPNTEIKHGGYYYCIFGDGLTGGVKVYKVVVFVYPVPSYPIIQGCNHEQYCVLEVGLEGSLTCEVKGIRPRVQLEWKTFYAYQATEIFFTNQQSTVIDNGETFDVTLTSTYQFRDESRGRLTIQCQVSESNGIFHLTTKIDLILKDNFLPTDRNDFPAKPNNLRWIIPVIAASVFLLVVSGIIIGRYVWKDKGNASERKSADKEELITMLPVQVNDTETISDLTAKFQKQIKGKYKDWYDAVQPIPYIKDRLYCVDRVFVEGGIEFLHSSEVAETQRVWKRLETYENVFNVAEVSSSRRILEGEPGYGKSTVSLQFAYDWCNPKPTSALKEVEILMLLRLRQLGGVPSIYKAIKRFILPKDTTLSEEDIKSILSNSKSVVVILDGFDEYQDKDSTTITDVMTIIARQMFQDFQVVTTTRASFLPKKYPPLTKRIRLTGFDENARRYYIRKAVVGDDDEGVKKIEGYLEENPILSDLCQVPLLFVLFAHMTHESEQFRKLASVTSFFRHMMSCFHSHMRNKMDDENVRQHELFETDHYDLDKLAFEAFSGQSQRIVWGKDEIVEQIGRGFYDQYVRIGILVEEEGFDIIDDPGTPINEHVQYKTEVRFYHKLFCEWYAAHYLVDCIQQNPNLDLSKFLHHLDPFDVQYLYRFACGLDPNSAKKIIDYLKKIEGGDKFTILCILEQTGQIDSIKDTIRQLCDEGVTISGYDSLLLQRSSLQILEIAARNEIAIKHVIINDCFKLVDLSKETIMTTSGLTFTSRIPVKKLSVSLYNTEMTEDEANDILEFSSKCPSLCCLRFGGSVPPVVFLNESILKELKSKKIEVFWRMRRNHFSYMLNFDTGRWENEDSRKEANSEKFQSMRSKFRQQLYASEDVHKVEVKEMRDRMRTDVLQRGAHTKDSIDDDDQVDGIL